MIKQLEKNFYSILGTKEEGITNKKLLLIIEDNQGVIEALTLVLDRDYDLLICKSYEETKQRNFSEVKVALLDIKIAYKDGIEIFSLLKVKYPDLKIIFHSAYPGNNENAKLANSLSHSGYLVKGSYDIAELLETIKNAF